MRYQRLDLNLLVALEALLTECNVTRAAERLNLGQSATSSALGRLREHFNDPLLVAVGRRLEPTARAQVLLPKVREALALTREIIEAPQAFDPGLCQRRFTVVASDYVAAVLMPVVSRVLAQVAPGVRLALRDLPQPRGSDVVSEALDYRRSDCVIVPQRRLNTDYPHVPLLVDQWCCIVCAQSAVHAQGLNLAAYRKAEHVVREFADGRTLAMDAAYLAEQGIERKVGVAVESFALMPAFVAGSDRVATLFRRQAEQFATVQGVRIVPAPLALPRALQVMQWHPYQQDDPALAWFRGLLVEQATLLNQA
ncbi:LysR family transcriptional regulator [Pseudomonas sp. M47T1]|uniref:LysR family transcriptional regulator n=1 Tax=Pseudomonas sp. M47T1 TaxID=1179778 RepID=UPI0002606BAD|nr:LysR family transcriptional regulator [Pseudomonas sp. M47T1]EIK95686.1 LysR family transcriptional regulator [Pseudomonas sp. M47T1]